MLYTINAVIRIEFVIILCLFLLCIIVIDDLRWRRQIRHYSDTDRITGKSSFDKFKKDAQKLIDKLDDSSYILVYMNIQNFKYINDTFGHAQGDALLKAIAEIMYQNLKEKELAARAYADHFVVLLHCNEDKLVERLHSLWNDMESSINAFQSHSIFFKTGIYCITEGDTDIEKVIDGAIYALNTLGILSENSCVYYNESMRMQIKKEKEIEHDMNRALENYEFEAYYQPKFDIMTQKIIGAEALVRWCHPGKGMIPPGEFIPFFEKNNFVLKLDLYIFEEVCKRQRQLLDEGIEPMVVSVNFSRRHLKINNWMDMLLEITKRYQVPTNLLELELTETIAEENFDLITLAANNLRRCGFRLSIDDFGSGYSSIQLIYQIPISVLKLDKSCFHENGSSRIESSIIQSLIKIAHENDIHVIWEGVETPEQAETVKRYGCRFVQGFLYARPMPFADYRAKLIADK